MNVIRLLQELHRRVVSVVDKNVPYLVSPFTAAIITNDQTCVSASALQEYCVVQI